MKLETACNHTIVKCKKHAYVLVIYALILYIAWAVSELLLNNIIYQAVNSDIITEIIREVLLKNIIWTLPAFILIRHYKSYIPSDLHDMFKLKANWLPFIPVFLVLTVFVLISSLRAHGSVQINSDISAVGFILYFFVGLTEEMVFRGWLLGSTLPLDYSQNTKGKWSAAAVNAVMFLAIHFPIWIRKGVFFDSFKSLGFITIIALSFLFSWCFMKSKRLIVPIVIHMYYDILIFMFI